MSAYGDLNLREEVARCLSRGMTSEEIQSRFRDRSTRRSIATTMSVLRKHLCIQADRHQGRPRVHFSYVRLTEDVDRYLRPEAADRGITTSELAMRILDKVAADALVDAVLDDGSGG